MTSAQDLTCSSFVKCDRCFEDNNAIIPAVSSCKNCNDNFCETHAEKHQRKREHVLTNLLTAKAPKPSTCPTHSEKHIGFCITCNEGFCGVCGFLKHKGHEINTIEEMQEQFFSKNQHLLEDLVKFLQEICNSRDELLMMQEKCDKINQAITSLMNKTAEKEKLLIDVRL